MAVFNPFQLWVRAADMKNVRVGWELLNESQANLVSSPAYQVADVEATGGHGASGRSSGGAGPSFCGESLSTTDGLVPTATSR